MYNYINHSFYIATAWLDGLDLELEDDLEYYNDTKVLPVVLEEFVVPRSKFVCEGRTKVLRYTFFCTIRSGAEILWSLNSNTVIVITPYDVAGIIVPQEYYPRSSDSNYSVTVVLNSPGYSLLYDLLNISSINTPAQPRVSTLTVEIENESQFDDIPFSVTCETTYFGEKINHKCKPKYYTLAGNNIII